jgi:hypothetical protein
MDSFEIKVELNSGLTGLAVVQLDEFGGQDFARFKVEAIIPDSALNSIIRVDTDCWMPPPYWNAGNAEEYYERLYYPNPVDWAYSDEMVFSQAEIQLIGKAICRHFCKKHLIDITTYTDDE